MLMWCILSFKLVSNILLTTSRDCQCFILSFSCLFKITTKLLILERWYIQRNDISHRDVWHNENYLMRHNHKTFSIKGCTSIYPEIIRYRRFWKSAWNWQSKALWTARRAVKTRFQFLLCFVFPSSSFLKALALQKGHISYKACGISLIASAYFVYFLTGCLFFPIFYDIRKRLLARSLRPRRRAENSLEGSQFCFRRDGKRVQPTSLSHIRPASAGRKLWELSKFEKWPISAQITFRLGRK